MLSWCDARDGAGDHPSFVRDRAEGEVMSGARWDAADTERLRVLAAAGLSRSEIAVEMARSKNAVRLWAEKLNIAIAKTRHPRQLQTRLETARLQRIGIETRAKKA
jgi:hypothetical protein